MRIISGRLKGRNIKSYDIEGTRPTMDRVRESLFSTIQDDVKESVVLDLFAGSGCLGIEAISNGAKYCYFNDKNSKCCAEITKCIKEFAIASQCSVTQMDYKKALAYYESENISFDLVFLDPPYSLEVLNEVVLFLCDHHLLNDGAVVVCEVSHLYLTEFPLEKCKIKKYNDKYVVIYRK